MLINLRNALMAGKRLPYDAEVEFLESSGTQYINTGIKPGPNTRVEITFAMTTFTANCGLFGARGNATADNNSYNLFIISNNGSRVRWDWSGSGQYQTSEAETSTDATYVLGAAGGNITRNGTTVMSVSASKAAINYPLYVFNFNNVGTPYSTGANARVWSVKIYDGQTLVFDAIPVRKKTVGYLYDRVSGKLFGNAGSGDFVLGPDVVPVEYIESHGTEYIDTGVIPDDSTGIEAVHTICANNSRDNIIFGARQDAGQTRYWCDVDWTDYSIGWGFNAYSVKAERFALSLSYIGLVITNSLNYMNDRAGKIDGVTYDSSLQSKTLATMNRSIYLFGANNQGTVGVIGRFKVYSAKISKGQTLVNKFLPVRVGTDATSWEGAMMDTLTRRIYRNAGTGAFGYGNDLKYPIPA